ncbi:MAG: APC family permease, partial [Microthrixaceae bacterium]
MSPTTPPPSHSEQLPPGLRRNVLGTSALTFIVVSAAAPLMVMVGVAPLALAVGGVGAPVAYLLGGALLTVFAVGFTTLSRHVHSGGAFYAYITRGLGKQAGITAALIALMSYCVIQIGIYGLLAVTADEVLSSLFGLHLPWPVYSLSGVLLVGYLGFRSIEFGARLLGITLVLETAILVLLAGAILIRGGATGLGLESLYPSNVFTADIAAVLGLALAAFLGFEATAIYRTEAREPSRTIPRATYAAVAFLAGFYGFIGWVIVQAFGADAVQAAAGEHTVGLFFIAAEIYLGSWASTAMMLLLLSSVVTSLLAFHNAITRYARAISSEGMLPAALGRIHPRTRTPYVAGGVQTLLALVVVGGFALAGADPYSQLLIWVNTPGIFGILALQIMTALAVLGYFRRTPHHEGVWRTVVAPVLAAIGLTAALLLILRNLSLLTAASTNVNTVLTLTLPT